MSIEHELRAGTTPPGKVCERHLDDLIASHYLSGHKRFRVRVITTAEAMSDFNLPPGECVLEAWVFAPSSAALHTAAEDAFQGCAAQVVRVEK